MGHPRSHRQAALPEMGPSHSGVTGRKFGTCGGKWFSLAELRIKFFFFFRGLTSSPWEVIWALLTCLAPRDVLSAVLFPPVTCWEGQNQQRERERRKEVAMGRESPTWLLIPLG